MSKRIRSLLILHDRTAVLVFRTDGGLEEREISRRHYEKLITLWHSVSRSYVVKRRLHAYIDTKRFIGDLRISRWEDL